MFSSLLILGFMSLASVNGLPSHEVAAYPPKSIAKAFKLVVKMTDPSKDFDAPVHNSYVNLAPVDSDRAAASPGTRGTVFFRNGTKTEQAAGQSTVLTDE
ncbi:hypothetical protein ACRE_025190 [Hapsidospora chrysogenum ATCC 11550]|uniref:Uncharacterized protein n=1 Tax=Hapsidospora chrysogenum (strain ATCC 11550 / CBS 779.69 / DSM 880 / IAM 14645 / JCM 23072 / IMI 49137) TaxID=857340 RepID=A0A086TBE7_HAPC1|nr:hypothetical protein ACRE_025190 [Hapsidospora chrysogenum ATCC 11550]